VSRPGNRSRIVVATADPVTARMPGPSIRAWHIAEALAADGHAVELVTVAAADRTHPAFSVRHVGEPELRDLEAWMDVLVFQGGLLRIHPFLVESDKVIVADIYDPFHLENLEPAGKPIDERVATITHLTGVLNDQLLRGDFFLCASHRQRDFWLGSLASLGRVNPYTYDSDDLLRSLIAIAPFGLPSQPPARTRPALRGVVPGIEEDDQVLLWAGGVYDWFDPLTLVRAIDRLRHELPRLRLFFLGMQHPNPAIPEMRMAAALRELAADLGLVGVHVFFNDTWVAYDDRANYLLDADIGVTTHKIHLETAFSFRTRILDYLWAGLPIVTSEGDELADMVAAEGLGAVVGEGDVDGLVTAIRRLLTIPDAAEASKRRVTEVAALYRWSETLAPLVEFCRNPRRAPDAAHFDELAAENRNSSGFLPPLREWLSRKRKR
jgi:glycosyltransferase involved in cell wall biosynthesis